MKRGSVLIVDDSEINRSILSDILQDDYYIEEASNGIDALDKVKRMGSDLSVILLDIAMPKMDGFEVLSVFKQNGMTENIPVIIISSLTSSASIDRAYDLGADEYITRPFDEKTVKRRISNIIALYSRQKALENLMMDQIFDREKNILTLVEILSHIVEFRNGDMGTRCINVSKITKMLLNTLADAGVEKLDPARIEIIANASILHDIGKISIPESLLNKKDPLTNEEYQVIRRHCEIGAEMLERPNRFQSEELVRTASDICRWHHERYDGMGYPDCLKGDEIPLGARVVSIADAYDSLISDRPYRPAFSHEQAINMITGGECGQFDPAVLEAFRRIAPEIEREVKFASSGVLPTNDIASSLHTLKKYRGVSARSIALLEQERTKYNFFASMSREIQFEYDCHSNTLTISDWGADELGISPIIYDPCSSRELESHFSRRDFDDLRDRLSKATPDEPIVSHTYRIICRGEERWFKAIVRPLWIDADSTAMTRVIGKFTDINEEQLELAKLKRLARCDSLTGLLNREYARKRITQSLDTCRKGNRKFTMMLLDLDFFKSANDNYGHMFGDRLLIDVARRLRACTREGDILARIGGDEFIVFLEYSGDAKPLVERIFHAVENNYQDFFVCASIGVTVAPSDGITYDTLFNKADQALYAAKNGGRKSYRFYNKSMRSLQSALTQK
ncbi:MAG: diguanylate cyclase [Clostridia bacterium]|nr:diguanylate cyclase [Clostridia bacterium]